MPRVWNMSNEEEVANAITHGVMALSALFLLPYVAVMGYIKGGPIAAVTKSVFVISLFMMFTSSCLYHSMAFDSKHKQVLRLLDHIFIFVAIAGSYTPMGLLIIGGPLGIGIVAFQWLLVLMGALYKTLSKKGGQKVSLAFYLLMGWSAVLIFPAIIDKAETGLIAWVVAGGLFYSVGAAIYAFKGFKYHHMIWHLFINLGALSHFIGIVFLI